MSPDWEFGSYFNVTTKINDMLENVGGSDYTYIFQKDYIWEWTSSEWSSYYAVFVQSGVDSSKGSGAVLFNNDPKEYRERVRPFLAF